jgi:predicted DNA-binding transcriptional regulator AlpA
MVEQNKFQLSDPSARLLSKEEVLSAVGVTYPALWQWIREKKFPAARSIGSNEKNKGRIAWLESEVIDWIKSRPARIPKPIEEKSEA